MESLLPPYGIGSRIRLLRQYCGLTQIELAQRLSVSQSWLSKVEAGLLDVSAQQLMALRMIFGVSSDSILDGVIPYYEISKKFDPKDSAFLEKYGSHPTTTLRAAYPFIATYEKFLTEEELSSILRDLKLRTYLLADPLLPVNVRFLWDLIDHGCSTGVFTEEASFQFLSEQAFRFSGTEEALSLEGETSNTQRFFERWIQVARTFGAGHEFGVESIDVPSSTLALWSKAPHPQKRPHLSEVFDKFYSHFLSRSLTEKDHQSWLVQIDHSSSANSDSANSTRLVRYRVSRK